MPRNYDCEYCGISCTTIRSLKRHQRTKISCLDIQRSRGLNVEREEYKCDNCDRVFTRKCELRNHQKKIHADPVHSETNINNSNNIINIVFNIGNSLSDDIENLITRILEKCLSENPSDLRIKILQDENQINSTIRNSSDKSIIGSINNEDSRSDDHKILHHSSLTDERLELDKDKEPVKILKNSKNKLPHGKKNTDKSNLSESEQNKILIRKYRREQLKIKEAEERKKRWK